MTPPRLELDWEEGAFRGLLSLWHRLSPAPVERSPGAIVLDPEHRGLVTLAQMLAAEPVRILAARNVGGFRGRDLLLPKIIDVAPDAESNRRFLVVRTAISAAMRRLSRDRPVTSIEWARSLDTLGLAREACDWLEVELPGFGRELAQAREWAKVGRPSPESLHGRARLLEEARRGTLLGERPWQNEALRVALERAPDRGVESPGLLLFGEWFETIEAADAKEANPEERERVPNVESEALAPAIEALRRVELDGKEKEDAVLIHNFEKVDTLDEFNGSVRDTDGSDDLDAHLDALDEINLGDLVRDDEVAHSLLRADLSLGLDVPDVASVGAEERGIAYDEWDGRKNHYRRDWCTVYPTDINASEPRWAAVALIRHARLIRRLRRRIEIHRTQLRALDHQLDGEEVDLSAMVDSHGSRRAGRGIDPRVYIRKERRRRDLATTILLDTSLSSDSWVANRRVLDVAREAVLVLGEVSDQLGDRLQILSFASHTRNRCRVWQVKGWHDTWSVARGRLGAIRPEGYTRIGPALRHATAELAAQNADHRLLLLVSDGKPTDYDRYEGRYGTADIRQALREADRVGVHTHALAVDAVARDYLPPMFGPGNWDVLAHPDQLPEVLTTVYGRWTGR
jgi:nitric oxide reductase NorD protein